MSASNAASVTNTATDTAGTACYCYAVARPVDPEVLTQVRGVGGERIHLVAVDPGEAGSSGGASERIVAVVGQVPADEFNTEALRVNLERFDWLEAVARRHNAVVDYVAAHTVTLPLRLATIYREANRAAAALSAARQQLSQALERLEGCLELGVKVYADHPDSGSNSDGTPAESGRSYLRRRLKQQNAAEAGLREAEQAARQVDERLCELARDRFEHRPQSGELAQHPGLNVLNVAYLVARNDSEAFAQEVASLDARLSSCRVELSGPWVPYSFSVTDLAQETAL